MDGRAPVAEVPPHIRDLFAAHCRGAECDLQRRLTLMRACLSRRDHGPSSCGQRPRGVESARRQDPAFKLPRLLVDCAENDVLEIGASRRSRRADIPRDIRVFPGKQGRDACYVRRRHRSAPHVGVGRPRLLVRTRRRIGRYGRQDEPSRSKKVDSRPTIVSLPDPAVVAWPVFLAAGGYGDDILQVVTARVMRIGVVIVSGVARRRDEQNA